jgi:hypothetical protein
MGDYVKYVDDFTVAISRWNRIWGTLTCKYALFWKFVLAEKVVGATKLKVTLQMSYEYLRLYTNAFAFQAAISQTLDSQKGNVPSPNEYIKTVFRDAASMQDVRFIHESMEAAKSYLTILNNFVDPEEHLRYMPLRYYL